jgi:hypothetical protein
VRSDEGKYALASPSEAKGPNRPDVLKTSLPESFRVMTIRCVEYLKLRHNEGLLSGKKRGSSWSKEANRKVPKKLLLEDLARLVPNRLPYAFQPCP